MQQNEKKEGELFISAIFLHFQLGYFNKLWGDICIMGLLLLDVDLQNLVICQN